MNIAGALAVIFKMGSEANKLLDSNSLSKVDADKLLATFRKFDRIFGFLNVDEAKKDEIPAEIIALAEARIQAKLDKNYAEADRIREEIKMAGYIIEDAPKNTYRIKKS